MKTARFDGIEFFCGIKEVFKTPDSNLTFNNQNGETTHEKIKVFEVGLIPYEWIEYVDLRGDEHGFIPLFFCHFKGKRYWKTARQSLLSLDDILPFISLYTIP